MLEDSIRLSFLTVVNLCRQQLFDDTLLHASMEQIMREIKRDKNLSQGLHYIRGSSEMYKGKSRVVRFARSNGHRHAEFNLLVS